MFNIAEMAMKKKVITIVLTLLVLFVGVASYNNLSRLEDPEFTIKEAIVITPYPGASAEEVEKEVTNVIEKAAQELGQLETIESSSKRNISQVKVTIKDQFDKTTLPQVWDELRRKVNDYQKQLPPGAGPSIVNDDFGDVYGFYIAVTGEGYTYAELWDFVDVLQRELLQAEDVKRIVIYGKQPEVIYVEMNREKMSQLGISQEKIYDALESKNLVADAGRIGIGTELIPINPTGEFTSEKQFGDLLISKQGSDRLIFLKDVANIKRGYKEPPDNLLRYDGEPAVGIAISTVLGGNVVTMGESLSKKLEELAPRAPIGMELQAIALQSEAVTKAVNGFLINLIEAVIIVVVVLLIAMGLRSGLIIGFILLLTISGTFIFMDIYHVTLERISLGALVIALGMLVDNAIVVVDGMKVRMEKGESAFSAAKAVVGQTAIPLLGATAVAICAFAAIGTSQDSTGEYCRTLYYVILISLSLSWITAVTSTPLVCEWFLIGKKKKKEKNTNAEEHKTQERKDPYEGKLFKAYKSFLIKAIKFRWVTIAVIAGAFLAAMFGFRYVDNSFFPDSTRPQFFIDFWMTEGTDIRDTSQALKKAEKYLMEQEGVENVATAVGGGEIRFLLTYAPESASGSYGQIIINVDDYKKIPRLAANAQKDLSELLPDTIINTRFFRLGPGDGGRIQLRISGPDREILREMAEKAENIIREDGRAQGVRNDWREKIKVVRPELLESQARRLGIERPDVARALEAAFIGTKTGVYREDEELLNIVARTPASERINVDNLYDLKIWSPVAEQMIPLRQIISDFKIETEDANIGRRDRKTTIKIHADPQQGVLPADIMASIKPKIEAALNVDSKPIVYNTPRLVKGMPGYTIAWGGEEEDSAKARASLGESIPIFFGLMVLIVICLFNAIRQPIVIWLTVPLSIIGVTVGLLMFKQPFGFMSLLGLMSLAGMLIKNAIVLVDQIDLDIKEGKDRLLAVIDSGVSRLRPVSLAALTTILGMTPLLTDAFFISMAVTIMFGLGFATVLTMVVVPVFYTVFFKIPYSEETITSQKTKP